MMIPWHLTSKPWPVQVEALKRSYGQPGYSFYMEMRLGKSSTALNEFLMLHSKGVVNRLLIFAPNKFKAGWLQEAKKFGVLGEEGDPMNALDWWVMDSLDAKGKIFKVWIWTSNCLLYTSPSPRDRTRSRMPSSA